MAQTLRPVEVSGTSRWRWLLIKDSGTVLADHQVTLDTGTAEYEAFCDLHGHLRRIRLPHDPIGSETGAVDRVGAWIGTEVFGRVGPKLSGTVRVVIPPEAEFLLSRPLELARVEGKVLARRHVRLVYELPGITPHEDKEPVGQSLRVLALFSLPARSSVLALRQERYELARTVRQIAARTRKAIELRVLQYGVTRERLTEAVEEYPGWDVLHVSGHGDAGALLLERANGDPDPLSTEDLVELLRPAQDRLKLAVLSACNSGAAMAAGTLRSLGLDDSADQVERAPGADPAQQLGLARGLVEELGAAVLAMRYPVADGFAVALGAELYPLLLGAGQPVDRAVGLAVPRAAGERPSAARPASSIGTPALFGASAVDLRVVPPPGKVVLDPYAERMAWFPREPKRFVGRTRALVEGSAALAPESGRTGVLFAGVVGAGKTLCALELAHQHRGRFGAMAWWRAPARPDEFDQALGGFAEAMEIQLDVPMVEAVGSEDALRRFLPRLAAVLHDEAVLLVLDNLDTLLSEDGTWRDPMWGLLMEALTGHGGLSRVVLTSRAVPSALDPDLVLPIPTHALTVAEAVLLARELPNLGALLHDEPTAERSAAVRVTGDRALARRVLNVAQGHPKLLELADAAATDPARLSAALSAAEAAGRDAPVAAFFTTGASALDGGQFMGLLTSWTDTTLSALPAPARALAELLAHVEEDHRRSWLIELVWPSIWAVHDDRDAPSLSRALEPLLTATIVETEPAAPGDPESTQVYRLHPGVAEAVRSRNGPELGAILDMVLARYLLGVYEIVETDEGLPHAVGPSVVWSGLAAVPYLLRRGSWSDAVDLVGRATDRDLSPETTHRALGYLRHVLDGETDDGRRLSAESRYAKVMGRIDPAKARALLRDAFETARDTGRSDLAATTGYDLAELLQQTGNLHDALEVAEDVAALAETAGVGPWTQASVQCLRLVILQKMGAEMGVDADELLTSALALLGRLDALPTDPSPDERFTPISVREVALSTALGAASDVGNWPLVLEISTLIQASHLRRGASPHERARLRLNDCHPLMRLGRHDEAERTLLDCQAVFEEAEDIELLGAVFNLRADLEGFRDRPEQAVLMAQAALRYEYRRPKPLALALGHDALSGYFGELKLGADDALAHRLAAVFLRRATEHRAGGITMVTFDDQYEYGDALFPATLDELVTRVEQVPGVHFRRTLAALVPDPGTLAELYADVVERLRAANAVGREAYGPSYRKTLHDAIHRAADGERGDGLFAGLDEAGADVIRMFLALEDEQPD